MLVAFGFLALDFFGWDQAPGEGALGGRPSVAGAGSIAEARAGSVAGGFCWPAERLSSLSEARGMAGRGGEIGGPEYTKRSGFPRRERIWQRERRLARGSHKRRGAPKQLLLLIL